MMKITMTATTTMMTLINRNERTTTVTEMGPFTIHMNPGVAL